MFMPLHGAAQMAKGGVQLFTEGQRAKGVSNLVRGSGKVLSPYLLPAAVASPEAVAWGVGTGMATAPLAEGGARLMGAEPDTARAIGDVAAATAGGLASSPGKAGYATRAMVRGGVEKLPLVGKVLQGVWDAGESALGGPGLYSGSRTPYEEIVAPTPGGTPKAAPGPSSAPKKAPVVDITSGRQPKPAPGSAPVVDMALLDDIAKGMAGKKFDRLTTQQQATVRRLAEQSSQPQAAPRTPTESKTLQESPNADPLTGEQTVISPEASGPIPAKPKTVREMLDDELAARQSGEQMVSAPKSPPQDVVQVAAREMLDRGFTPDDLVALTPEQRAETLGPDAARFNDILREMRSHATRQKMDTARANKDQALVRFFKARGITPEQVAGMDEGTLATHIKSAGYKPPGKSGTLGRSHSQVRHDIVEAMKAAPAPEPRTPAPAPGSQPRSTPQPQPTPVVEPKAEVAPSVKPETPAEPAGISAWVRTPSGTKAKVRYKISEAKDLKTSFDSDYNTEIGHQPRDTSRVSSRQRIEQRRSDMDPNAMGVSVMAGDGAPITTQGHAVTRNHGTRALQENYQMGGSKAGEYKNWVQENAGLAGMTPEQVAGMKEPVLHRELVEPWDHSKVKQFADEANMSSTARMSEAELAKQMAQKLKGPSMGRFKVNENGVPDAEFVRSMLKDLPVEEQGEFIGRGGEITQKGVRLVRNAVFERAYSSSKALETMAESTNPQVKNISNAMLNAAPEHARLADAIESGDAYDLGIGQEVGRAMETIENLRQGGKSVPDYLKQESMLGKDPAVNMLMQFFSEQSRRPSVMRAMLNNYAESVFGLGNPKQGGGLFGEPELPTKVELLEAAYQKALADRAPQEEPSLFIEKE